MFNRLLHFWASQFITERLLASPLFNRIAAKTHQNVSALQKQGSERTATFIKAFKENLEKENRKSLRK